MAEAQIRLAARMYEARDAVRFLLGERYDGVMREYGEALRDIQQRRSCGELEAALELAKADGITAHQQLYTIAAAVELCERSSAEDQR